MDLDNFPAVTRAQMMEVDRSMIEEYGITLLQMMENAGRDLALLSRQILGGTLQNKRVAVLCGGGNNGGGGMAAARHISNWGGDVYVSVALPLVSLKDAPVHQLDTLGAMEIPISEKFPSGNFDLIIDALVGYGLQGAPRGKFADWIDLANRSTIPILSLDIPSGLDADTGHPPGACIRAHTTLTLALPKIGMRREGAKDFVGILFLGDISVPPGLLQNMGLEVKGTIFTSYIMELL
jgi:NAD(P)H-hydrate epimerase